MRAISQYGEYGIQIRHQQQKGMGDGSIQVTVEPIYAKFKNSSDALIYETEVERAHKMFGFRGRYQHVDEATPADILYRLSVLDTEQQGWDDETRGIVEAELLRLEPINDDFFIATEVPVPAPYPAWDYADLPAFQLVAGLVQMGFDLNQALTYEKVFGPRREEVIEALEAVIADQAQSVETVSA
jgi:hypothetical protein